jgi:arylsulfatase A-like enzyme
MHSELTFKFVLIRTILALVLFVFSASVAQSAGIVHDAEYYILEAQNGERWKAEDGELDKKLANLRKKHGQPPNIIHIMWDDQSFGDCGIPAIQKIRGYETPHINRLAEEGILFTRMYTEVGCTPSRAAVVTGRHAVRSGMYHIGFPVEASGMRAEEVTMAEVLSKAGYATAFYGKWHLGDIEQAWPHLQGFDETLFAIYNQIASIENVKGEAANATMGLMEGLLVDDPYKLDNTFSPKGYVFYVEGESGEDGREWRGTTHEDYLAFDPECKKRTMDFIRNNAQAKKPFYAAYWPLDFSFIPSPQKQSRSRGIFTDDMQGHVDVFIGEVMEELKKLGIAENTLLVCMADNGPMAHNPPPGLGMVETIFRGGKGDFTEGGVRVPAFAWWPGVIEAGQLVGDIIHEVDLYTTFARLAGATQNIPTDRIIDGIDQTALFLEGDTHGRRDYVHIYQGPTLGATVKGDWKRHWISGDPGDASGIAAAYYFLPNDTREKNALMANVFHFQESFNRMRQRHAVWKKKYPDSHAVHGAPFTGLSNARPETQVWYKLPVNMKDLPFDPTKYMEYELPYQPTNR